MIIAVVIAIQAIANNPKKKIGTSTGFEPMASTIALQSSTSWAMKTHTLRGGEASFFRVTVNPLLSPPFQRSKVNKPPPPPPLLHRYSS